MIGTIQRMIFWDLLKVFSLALVGLTAVLVLCGVVVEASQRGLAPTQILSVIPLMIPGMLPYTIPATTLFATCLVYGRLAADNEITALRAAGINLWSIVKPCLFLGVATTTLTFGLYMYTIPMCMQHFRVRVVNDLNEVILTLLKRQLCLRHPRIPYVIYARDVQGRRLIDAIFKRREVGTDRYDPVVRAREASMRIETRIDPATGRPISEMVIDMSRCSIISKSDGVAGTYQHFTLREPLPQEVFGDKDRPPTSDLIWPDIAKREVLVKAKLAEKHEEVVRAEANLKKPGENPVVEEWIRGLRWQESVFVNDLHQLAAERQFRPAMAVACLCFVLVGCPVGIRASRGDYLSTFVSCFLPIIGLYYPMMICANNLGRQGKLNPILALWTADGLFILVAATLIWRLVRR